MPDTDHAGSAMQVRILGPAEVLGADGVIPLPPRVLDLLAVLACRPHAVVSTEQLIDALWPSGPPRTAGKTLQVRVHELRRALGRFASVDYQRQGTRQGYLLAVETSGLDAAEFENLLRQGRVAFTAGCRDEGAELLRRALELWRGPAFPGHEHVELVRQEAARLDELRWQATEELMDADLALGRHASVVGKLRGLAAEHPFREHLQAQLMIALCRLGRHGDALTVYRETRRQLVEELGLEPGRELQDVHQAILNNDPVLDPPGQIAHCDGPSVRLVVPTELPADLPTFAGRSSEIALLGAMLTTAGPPAAVVAISGPGGIGKSTLAVHVSHTVADEFPDGQLFANLHGSGAGGATLGAIGALGRFLRALGVSHPPAHVDEAAARFRSLTAGRRMLIVLDNAADVAQVKPLLPGSGACTVLITSRTVLSTLDKAAHLRLGTLSEQASITLLGHLAGARRVASAPAAARQIARLCGHLPLALRICGARLVAHPERTLGDFAGQLSNPGRRLDHLQHADLAVRASIAVSHRDLVARLNGAAAFRLLELIALLDLADITTGVAAALTDQAVDQTQVILDQLIETQLLETSAPGCYHIHELIRLYAREQAAVRIPEQELRAAIHRAMAHHTAIGRQVTDPPDQSQAHTRRVDDAGVDLVTTPTQPSSIEASDWLEMRRAPKFSMSYRST